MYQVGPRHCCVLTSTAVVAAVLLCVRPASAHDGVAGQIADLSIQIARDPHNAELVVRRADLYRATRQWNEALADLERARQLDPSLPNIDVLHAQVFSGQGRYREADRAATRCLERNAQHAEALVIRARARAALGRPREAVADFSTALEVRSLPELYIERAGTAAAAAGPGSAIAGLDEGIARLGPIPSLELAAITYELKLRRFDAALDRLDGISARSVRQESWLARRGEILELAKRTDAARAAYDAALTRALSLPPAKQKTRATSLLITQLRAHLARLQGNGRHGSHTQGQ
jgi:tetratricopeptide (TPR) repeat protein